MSLPPVMLPVQILAREEAMSDYGILYAYVTPKDLREGCRPWIANPGGGNSGSGGAANAGMRRTAVDGFDAAPMTQQQLEMQLQLQQLKMQLQQQQMQLQQQPRMPDDQSAGGGGGVASQRTGYMSVPIIAKRDGLQSITCQPLGWYLYSLLDKMNVIDPLTNDFYNPPLIRLSEPWRNPMNDITENPQMIVRDNEYDECLASLVKFTKESICTVPAGGNLRVTLTPLPFIGSERPGTAFVQNSSFTLVLELEATQCFVQYASS